ncbi:MAG: MFS transporter, partial [Proteobacteria bacterium]|nr:MFS transporter [Pseudomonadota bacterium]
QGLSVGGELTISIVYLGEESEAHRRGFGASWTFFGSTFGALCGSALIGLLNTTLGHEAVMEWGWRLPFLFSGVIGAAALLLRYIGVASEGRVQAKSTSPPIVDAVRLEGRAMIAAFLFCVPAGVVYYVGLIYLVTFVQNFDAIPAAEGDYIVSAGMVTILICLPLFALLADRVGWRKVMACGAIGLILYSWPMFWMLTQKELWLAYVAEIGFAVLEACYAGPLPAMLAMQFRPEVRCTAASVSYGLAMATLGGTAPMIVVYLIARTGYMTAPAWYMILGEVAGLCGLAMAKRTPAPI